MARGERFRIRSELREERWARGRIEQVGSQRETVASDAQTRSTVRRITTLEFIINASSAVLKKTNESTKNAFVRSFVRLCALWIIGEKKFGIVGRVIIGRSLAFFPFYCFESRVYGRKEREREREIRRRKRKG